MRHNGRAPILASSMRPQHLNLREGEPRLVVCPDCETWHRLTRSMIAPHRDGTEAPRPSVRRVGDKPAGGRRCPGSAQRITIDLTPEQWGKRLLEAEATAAARRSKKVLPKVKTPAEAAAGRPSWQLRKQGWASTAKAARDTDTRRAQVPAGNALPAARSVPLAPPNEKAVDRRQAELGRQYSRKTPATSAV